MARSKPSSLLGVIHGWHFATHSPSSNPCYLRSGAVNRRLFLVAATTENDDELTGLVAALGAGPVLVVALRVRPGTAAARVLAREPEHWTGRFALAQSARRLALAIPSLSRVDLVLDTPGASPLELARSIYQAIHGGATG